MKKTIIASIAVLVLLPSFANASWWNPISWFSFLWSKPQVVEKVIPTQSAVVIEAVKPETDNTPVATSTNAATSTPKTPKSTVKPTVKPVVKSVIKEPVVNVVPVIKVETPIATENYGEILKKVQSEYSILKNKAYKIAADNGYFTSFKEGVEGDRAEYIKGFVASLDKDIQSIDTLIGSSDISKLKTYDLKFGSLESQFNKYESDYRKTSDTLAADKAAQDKVIDETLKREAASKAEQALRDAISGILAHKNNAPTADEFTLLSSKILQYTFFVEKAGYLTGYTHSMDGVKLLETNLNVLKASL